MTLDHAIVVNGDIIRGLRSAKGTYGKAAIKLGIEALKEVKKARYGDPALAGDLLPGETEE